MTCLLIPGWFLIMIGAPMLTLFAYMLSPKKIDGCDTFFKLGCIAFVGLFGFTFLWVGVFEYAYLIPCITVVP